MSLSQPVSPTTTGSSVSSGQPIAPETLYAPIAPWLEQVKESIRAIVPPDSMLLADTMAHSLSSGGKLLRPCVALLMASALGNDSIPDMREYEVIETAAVTEMIHIATLLHDDVLDEADLRRGKSTVRCQWGNTVSVLSGDFLLAQSSMKLANIGNIRLVRIFSHVLADLCDGEVEQIRTSFQMDNTWDSYFHKTICKTASLFSAGCESVGVLHGLPEAGIQQLRGFGKSFGIAFQIVDDLLDYTADAETLGKPVLDDLRNGLVNAPVLLALQGMDGPMEHQEARQALREDIQALFNLASESSDGESTDLTLSDEANALVERIRQHLITLEALEQTRQLAQRYVDEALSALSCLPDSKAKDVLAELTRSVIYRVK